MKVAVILPPVVPESGPNGVEGVHTIIRQLCAVMTEHSIEIVPIVAWASSTSSWPNAVVIDMPYLPSLEDEDVIPTVRASIIDLSRQFADALRSCDACLVYDIIFDAYHLPVTIALCHAARALSEEVEASPACMAHRTGAPRLVFYTFECTWSAERVGGFDWDRTACWPWNEIGVAVRDHVIAFPAASTQAKIARITGLDLSRWHLLPPLLDPADEPHLDPAVVALWHQRGLWSKIPVIFLPALNRENNDILLAMRVTGELKRLGHEPRLLLTFSPSARWEGNPDRFRALESEAHRLGLDDEVVLLAGLRLDWREGLPRKALQAVYHLADLVLFPTDWEGFGLVAIEALAARVPLLCTDLPVLREITDGKANYFSLEDTDAAIAQRVLTVLEEPANRARRTVRRYLDVEANYDAHWAPLLSS